MKRYNLSFKRIISRLFLTGVVGIIFGIAMFPFMRVANGLLFEQRAAIGGENMIRMVILWAIYTLIFSLFTFWKKRFRMVSVLLMVCLAIATGFVIFATTKDRFSRCLRSYPYENPKEFDRALDLIAQRLNVENNPSTVSLAFNFRNCLEIQYTTSINGKDNLEAAFLPSASTLEDLKILVDNHYKSYDDLTIATVLVHELTHANQFIDKKINKTNYECFAQESDAFTSQSIFLSQLNNEERRSIFARIKDDVNINSAFPILLQVDQITTASYNACSKLKIENNLNTQQFNECVWTGTNNKLKKEVESDKYYHKQCQSAN